MTAREHDDFGAERQDRPGKADRLALFALQPLQRGLNLLVRRPVRRMAGQHACLRDVRRHDAGARQDLAYERNLGVIVQQASAGLADHHRIEHHGRLGRQLVQRAGYRVDGLDAAEHPHLDGVHADVRNHRTDLG